MGDALAHGSSLSRYLIPIAFVVVIVVLRNSRPRPLRIARLWIGPAIYIFLLASSLTAAPPETTPLGIGLLIGGFLIGAGLGWQRARFTKIHIHPETHELSSRASPIGLIFIVGVLALRVFARSLLTGAQAADLHLPIIAAGDALLAMAVALLAAQRLEIWLRASRMLAEARASPARSTPA
jgi:hypothetical protein